MIANLDVTYALLFNFLFFGRGAHGCQRYKLFERACLRQSFFSAISANAKLSVAVVSGSRQIHKERIVARGLWFLCNWLRSIGGGWGRFGRISLGDRSVLKALLVAGSLDFA